MRELVEVALFSDDVDAARAFHSELVGATPVADWPGGAIFATGIAKILVHERAAALDGGPPNEDHFAVSVEDLDETCAALVAAGHAFLLDTRLSVGPVCVSARSGRSSRGARAGIGQERRSAVP